MTTVSIIIPVYNAARTINRAIDAALGQEGVDVEVLVVDDSSVDGTSQIIAERYHGNKKVILLSTPFNSGPSFARNLAIAEAKGEWISILDADDWIARDRSQVLLDFVVASGVDIVADSYYLCKEQSSTPHAICFSRFAPKYRSALIDPCVFIRCGMGSLKPMIRREFLLQTGISYDTLVWRGEDMKFAVMLMMRNGRIELVNRPMYFKQETPGSLSTASREQLLVDMRSVFLSLEQLASNNDTEHKSILDAIHYRMRVVEDALASVQLKSWIAKHNEVRWPGLGTISRALRHVLLRRSRFPRESIEVVNAGRT